METAVGFFWSLVYLILYISFFYFFMESKQINTFVKGAFISACSFRIIAVIFEILIYRFSIDSINKIFGWDGNLGFIFYFFNCTGHFLLIYGLSFFIGKEYNNVDEAKSEYPIMEGRRRSIGISLLLFVVTLGIYFPFWLYRTVKDLKINFNVDIPYTPGKAVGFLFIPIFNIYWGFYIFFSLPLKIKQIEEKYYGDNLGFYFHPILIPILWILFSIMSNFQFYESFDKSIIGNVLFFESAIFVFWLTIQAKVNTFFEFEKAISESK